jgi:uncharacterized Zn finger protein (UPF0148 family)
MSETKSCIVCGNPFDYEGEVCYYCEVTHNLNQEENMKHQVEEPEFDKVEFTEEKASQEAPKIQSHQAEAATPPQDNGETVHYRVIDVVKEGTQILEDLLNDGYLAQNVAGSQEALVYVCTKVVIKK